MKKITILTLAAGMMLTLSGCKDASVSISNGKEELFRVGDTKVTNNDIYTPLFSKYGYAQVSYEVSKIIYDKEVPMDDAMTEDAKDALEKSKSSLGEDAFKSMLTSTGYADEDAYYEKVSIPSVQSKALTKKFLEENAEKQIETYKPVKARILACTSEENAKNALSDIEGGADFEETAEKYGKTDTYKGNEIIVNQSSGLPSVVWAKISVITDQDHLISEVIQDATTDAANPTYYVVKVEDTDALNNYKEEALNSILEKSTTVSDDAMIYYLEKYDFHVYDIDIYNKYKANKAAYLIQDK